MRNLYSVCILSVLSIGYSRNVKAYPTDIAYPVQCGKVHRRSARIVNGVVSDELNFPSIVSIKRDGIHYCGGVIISVRHVLSAAHCGIEPDGNWSVTLGEYNLAENETFSTIFGIDEVITHEEYGIDNRLVNDIVILKLSEDIKWTEHIQPICLPTENIQTSNDALAVGWGIDIFISASDNRNNKLRSVRIDILENEQCNDIYMHKNLRLNLTKTQMCAGKIDGEVRDTNSGDSGGPLLVEHDGKQVLVGITSGSPPETLFPRSPGVYTRVYEYLSWILREIHQVTYYPPLKTNKLV